MCKNTIILRKERNSYLNERLYLFHQNAFDKAAVCCTDKMLLPTLRVKETLNPGNCIQIK